MPCRRQVATRREGQLRIVLAPHHTFQDHDGFTLGDDADILDQIEGGALPSQIVESLFSALDAGAVRRDEGDVGGHELGQRVNPLLGKRPVNHVDDFSRIHLGSRVGDEAPDSDHPAARCSAAGVEEDRNEMHAKPAGP